MNATSVILTPGELAVLELALSSLLDRLRLAGSSHPATRRLTLRLIDKLRDAQRDA